MDRDIHLVIILINDANRLLKTTIGIRQSHQSSKLSNAKIDMNNEVAGLHFLQFLHRQRHLAGTGAIATKGIFMEAIKYLMVGEEAELQIVVGKSLVKGLIYRLKLDPRMSVIRACLVKDILQTLLLFLTVGENIEFVSSRDIVFQRLLQQLKILME